MRAFTPTRAEHGYEPRGSVLETNTEDLPFLVDSVTAELQRARPGHRARAAPDRRHRARRRRPHRPRPATRATRRRASRSCTSSSTAASRPRSSPTLEDGAALRARPTCAASCATSPRCAARVAAHDRARRGRRGAATPTRSTRRVAFLDWLLQRQLHLPRLPRVRASATSAARASCRAPGLGLLADEATLGLRRAGGARLAARQRCASGRPTGELLLVSKTNRLSPVHRRVRMDYVGVRQLVADGADRRRGAAARPVHHQGLRRARRARRRCWHRKLRRILATEDLIEGSHDYKAAVSLFESFPKDELFAAPHRGPARARSSRCSGLHGDQVRVLGRRDAGRAHARR